MDTETDKSKDVRNWELEDEDHEGVRQGWGIKTSWSTMAPAHYLGGIQIKNPAI